MNATAIQTGMSTVSKTSGGIFGKFFSLILSNKFWTISFIILLILLIGSFKEAIETKSVEPLIFNFAGLVILPDEVLYNTIQNVDETYPIKIEIDSNIRWDNFVNDFKYYWQVFKWWWGVFSSLWMIVAVINFLRKLRIKGVNDSEKAKASWFAFRTVFIIYLFVNPVFAFYHKAGETIPEWSELSKDVDFWISTVPFKGTLSLFKHLIFDRDYFNAGYERAKGMYNLTGEINGTG